MDVKRRKPNRKSKPMKLKNGNSSSVMMVEMDTSVPLSQLKHMVGLKLEDERFNDADIYLQDILLDPELPLYEQGVKVSGTVEMSVETENDTEARRRLTIVEIAKNITDEELKALGGSITTSAQSSGTSSAITQHPNSTETSAPKGSDVPDVPCDPAHWTAEQVQSWMAWIAKCYNLDTELIKNTGLNGRELCELSIEDFFIKFPYGNIFWAHLSLLKKTSPNSNTAHVTSSSADENAALNLVINDRQNIGNKKLPNSGNSSPKLSVQISSEALLTPYAIEKNGTTSNTRSHAGGQIQLWQFLLELLTDADERSVIQWVGDDGEFKFLSPEKVAQKWGERKGKPAMNYEKLSRALRYYYDGDMISKVSGKRFQYKFVCNLKEIVGYDAAELNKRVIECVEKRKAKAMVNEN